MRRMRCRNHKKQQQSTKDPSNDSAPLYCPIFIRKQKLSSTNTNQRGCPAQGHQITCGHTNPSQGQRRAPPLYQMVVPEIIHKEASIWRETSSLSPTHPFFSFSLCLRHNGMQWSSWCFSIRKKNKFVKDSGPALVGSLSSLRNWQTKK